MRLSLCLLVALAWAGLGRAQAQDPKPSTVLVVRVAGDDNIVLRLRAELSSYRFRVVELPSSKRTEALSHLAEEREAQAALRAKPQAMAVEVWVRPSHSAARSHEELVNAGPGRDAAVLAVRVTETMRARGLVLPPLSAAADVPAANSGSTAEVEAAPEAAKPAAAVSEEVEPARPTVLPPARVRESTPAPEPKRTEPDEEKERKAEPEPEPAAAQPVPEPEAKPEPAVTPRNALLYAEVGPSGVWSPSTNSLGLGLDVFVSVKFRPYPTSSISLVGLIPLLGTDYTTSDGTTIDVQTFGIGGFGDLHLPLGPVEINVGIGGMALLSSVQIPQASESEAYDSNIASQNLAALLGRVGASVSLTPDLRLAASIMLGLTVKDLQLKFVNAEGQRVRPDVLWGKPLLFGTLSLELALPWDR